MKIRPRARRRNEASRHARTTRTPFYWAWYADGTTYPYGVEPRSSRPATRR